MYMPPRNGFNDNLISTASAHFTKTQYLGMIRPMFAFRRRPNSFGLVIVWNSTHGAINHCGVIHYNIVAICNLPPLNGETCLSRIIRGSLRMDIFITKVPTIMPFTSGQRKF